MGFRVQGCYASRHQNLMGFVLSISCTWVDRQGLVITVNCLLTLANTTDGKGGLVPLYPA